MNEHNKYNKHNKHNASSRAVTSRIADAQYRANRGVPLLVLNPEEDEQLEGAHDENVENDGENRYDRDQLGHRPSDGEGKAGRSVTHRESDEDDDEEVDEEELRVGHVRVDRVENEHRDELRQTVERHEPEDGERRHETCATLCDDEGNTGDRRATRREGTRDRGLRLREGDARVRSSQCTAVCTHAYMHTYMHTYIHAHMHAYIHAHMHTCIQTLINAYTHTHIHALTLLPY